MDALYEILDQAEMKTVRGPVRGIWGKQLEATVSKTGKGLPYPTVQV